MHGHATTVSRSTTTEKLTNAQDATVPIRQHHKHQLLFQVHGSARNATSETTMTKTIVPHATTQHLHNEHVTSAKLSIEDPTQRAPSAKMQRINNRTQYPSQALTVQIQHNKEPATCLH